jgi:hypothetical protein
MHDIQDAEALTLLRRYLSGIGAGDATGRERRLKELLPCVEPMVWKHYGQPRGASWRRLLLAIRAELARSKSSLQPGPAVVCAGVDDAVAERRARVVHVPDDSYEYPDGTRLDVVGAEGSDAVDVELNPFGRYRVATSERTHTYGRNIPTLTLQLVR